MTLYAKYTLHIYREIGDQDRVDMHNGKGATAAQVLIEDIQAEDDSWSAHALRMAGREVVEEIPTHFTEDPIFEDDPDPNQVAIDALIAARNRLLGKDTTNG